MLAREEASSESDTSRAQDSAPDPEVVAQPQRRIFTAEYKQWLLEAAETCKHGELGALLRREGVTYSTLRNWRRARDEAVGKALQNGKPGPVAQEPIPLEGRVAELERDLARVKGELAKAKVIIDVQKKVSELLAPGSKDEHEETS